MQTSSKNHKQAASQRTKCATEYQQSQGLYLITRGRYHLPLEQLKELLRNNSGS